MFDFLFLFTLPYVVLFDVCVFCVMWGIAILIVVLSCVVIGPVCHLKGNLSGNLAKFFYKFMILLQCYTIMQVNKVRSSLY